jgi:hypothetical protein
VVVGAIVLAVVGPSGAGSAGQRTTEVVPRSVGFEVGSSPERLT